MKYMLRKFIDNNITFGRRKTLFKKSPFGVPYGKPVTYTTFICDYIPVDKNITIPKDKEKAKEFFKYINEYESESEESDSDSDSGDAPIHIVPIYHGGSESNNDNQLTPIPNTSGTTSENNEIVMDDLFKNDSEWDDLINDTDSVS